MFSRRVLSNARALQSRNGSNLIRPFSSSAPQQQQSKLPRSPALANISPDAAATFDAKQKEFREATRAERKVKEQQDSQSHRSSPSPSSATATATGASSSSSAAASQSLNASSSFSDYLASVSRSASSAVESAASASDVSSASSHSPSSNVAGGQLPLGSLSTNDPDAKLNEEPKRKGPLASLIYGTKEGQQMDEEIERSFSQVLARGKYVHSIVFHQVKPDRVDEYVDLVGKWYPKMASMPDNKVNLVGSWRTEVGDCDTFVHIWEYQRYHGYHASLHSIASHPDFPEFDRKLKQLITAKNTSIMQEFSFWPTTSPRQLGGLFELRSYTLHPGNLLEWETHWRRGLRARREVMEGVGAWFVQIGELNTVHHLWQFADLEERKLRRERSWNIEGWGETVHKTVPLIQTMKSRVLIPMPWSPVA